MEAARSSSNNATRSSPARLLQLLLTLMTSPAAASRVIVKNKRVRLQAQHGGAFECRTCARRFATFQALGGHRTSHKRPRVRAHGLDLLLGVRPGKATAAPVQHRCATCGQTFPTGQALGGHMRRHRPLSSVVAGAVATATWSESATSPSSSSGLSFQPDDDGTLGLPTFIEFI